MGITKNDYVEFLKNLSRIPIERIDTEPLERMLDQDYEHTLALIGYRVGILSYNDYNCWSGLLCVGFFRQFDEKHRLACICICIEASAMRHKIEIEKSCEKYVDTQPLFKQFPHLYSAVRDNELIDYEGIQRLSLSHTISVKRKKGFGVIDYRVPTSILNLLDEKYNGKPIFIRLDPYKVSDSRIPDHIEEAVVNMPDPIWWSDLRIYNGKEKGSSYQLLNDMNDKDNYWDYFVRGIRRLEFHAERRDSRNPYLSMMMEELELHKSETAQDGNYLVGRMIHLDTNAKVGDDFKDAQLMHIDLAYNYYFEDNLQMRMEQDLSKDGRVVDASVRTHILRIENIQLNELFPIAFAFFKSQTMVNEWCDYQFRGAGFDAKHRIVK